MSFSKGFIQFKGLPSGSFRLGHKFFLIEDAGGHKVSIDQRELGVSERIARVYIYCLLKVFDSFFLSLRTSPVTIEMSLEEHLVSLRVDGLALCQLLPLAFGQVQT